MVAYADTSFLFSLYVQDANTVQAARIGSDEDEFKVHARIVEKNPKKKKIATVACMRRLAVRMWHIGMHAQIEAGVYKTKELPCSKRIAV